MKTEKSQILDKLGKDSGFKVPEGFFEQFNQQLIDSLPDVTITNVDEKPSMWVRVRPYLYMAATFAGIWCMMKVFNHFYGGTGKGLTIGQKQQDVEKEHGLTIKINGQSIIDPKYHVYFIDCDQKESSAYEGSTSKINEQEAEVAMRLLRELDNASNDLVKQGKIRVSGDKKIDERPSVGVICTYGDQAGLIKKKRKSQQFNGFSGKPDERLIISTVDDFQGDERDIIILSMVRNPSGNRFDAEFIKKFERINVALSRARKLLIIVGARKFLSEAGVIDLPDLSGDRSRDQINFHVYEKIIDTIYCRGRVLVASDIIGG